MPSWLSLLAALQVAVPDSSALPVVTLADALEQAARLDPNYVRALGQIDNAVWARRSAFAVFILPAVSATVGATRNAPAFFNFDFVNPKFERHAVQTQVIARYDLFTGGQKLAELSRTGAALDGAHAEELAARFATALLTESNYYDVLAAQELTRVSRERLRRAEDQLGIARARVLSGAAVQTDSLQLRLELTRARVGLIEQESALRVARLQLGRRVGAQGPVDAAPLDSASSPELPLTLADAITDAAAQGPQYRVAQANERAARAAYRARLGDYLPHAALSWSDTRNDNSFYPNRRWLDALTLTVSFTLWDNGRREIALTQARVNRDVARTVRQDMDRAVQHDVTAAYDAYETARASATLAVEGVAVARETFRVQQSRYSAGAITSFELLEAQVNLSEAESRLVQARYATRLALTGLEAILGKRLFSSKDSQ